MRTQWTEEEINILKKYYGEMTNKQLGELIGRTKSAIDTKANKLGLKSTKYTCDLDYFENINNEEKAYWLGFIYADGYVEYSVGKGGTLGIELSAVDENHLKKFNKSIHGNFNTTRRVRHLEVTNKDYETCCLKIHKKQFVEHLVNQGVMPNKSKVIDLPNIPKELMRHFIRGFFDGDGCLTHDKTRSKNCTQDVIKADFACGSIDFVGQLRKILYEAGIKSYICQEKNHYRLRIGGLKNTHEFLEYIYKDSSVYLDRKHEKKLFYYKEYNLEERIASLYRNV